MKLAETLSRKPHEKTRWLCSLVAQMVADSDAPIDSATIERELLVYPERARVLMHRVAKDGDAEVYQHGRLFICKKGTKPRKPALRDPRQDGKRYLRHAVKGTLMTTPKRVEEVCARLPNAKRASIDSALSQLVARGEVKAIKTKGENWRRYVLA